MSNLKVNTINDASGGTNAVLYGVASPTGSMGFRNRIINGDMRIDQRNAGASVSASLGNFYVLDRWQNTCSIAGTYSVQRSSVAPTGFVNSLANTVSAAITPVATAINSLTQSIEGLNCSDLMFGTASASTVTLSFWVRSSVTGTYSVSLANGLGATARRAYIANYSVASADTWQYVSLTIPGDTSGTWLTDTGIGISVSFDLGSGTNHNATAGAWGSASGSSAQRRRTSDSVNWVSNAGATFYITGVQLEAGSVATPFERRPYGTELALCQRYYEVVNGASISTRPLYTVYGFRVTKRAVPSLALVSGSVSGANFASSNVDQFACPDSVAATGASGWAIGASSEL